MKARLDGMATDSRERNRKQESYESFHVLGKYNREALWRSTRSGNPICH
jgi:hypothetical protein